MGELISQCDITPLQSGKENWLEELCLTRPPTNELDLLLILQFQLERHVTHHVMSQTNNIHLTKATSLRAKAITRPQYPFVIYWNFITKTTTEPIFIYSGLFRAVGGKCTTDNMDR